MKSISLTKYLILLGIIIAIIILFYNYDNKIEFTRLVRGKTTYNNEYSDYHEKILVKNMPWNNLKQSIIMISYFDSIGLSIDDFASRMPEISYYSMFFYKDTYATREHFMELNEYWVRKKSIPNSIAGKSYNGNKNYLGSIGMIRCKNDTTKWRIDFSRNLGTADSYEHQGPRTETTTLLNECNYTHLYDVKKEELIEYYNDLIEKKKAKVSGTPIAL